MYSTPHSNLYNNYHYRNSSLPKESASTSSKVIGTTYDPYQPKVASTQNLGVIERKPPNYNSGSYNQNSQNYKGNLYTPDDKLRMTYRKNGADQLINNSYNIINNNPYYNNSRPFGKTGNYNYYNKNNYSNLNRRDQVGELLNYSNRENLMDYTNTVRRTPQRDNFMSNGNNGSNGYNKLNQNQEQ